MKSARNEVDYPGRDPEDKIDADPVKPKVGISIDLAAVWRWIKRRLRK